MSFVCPTALASFVTAVDSVLIGLLAMGATHWWLHSRASRERERRERQCRHRVTPPYTVITLTV
jgi:hypothetical protein